MNAQALHLDSLEVSIAQPVSGPVTEVIGQFQVLDMVPNDWPVRDMSDFFGRALKRQLHERSHWQSELLLGTLKLFQH